MAKDSRAFIGVDPGAVHGRIFAQNAKGSLLCTYKLPNRKYQSDAKTKKGNFKTSTMTDPHAVRRLFIKVQGNRSASDMNVAIEMPTVIQGSWGAGPSYTMAASMGFCMSTAISLKWRVLWVPPKAWQDELFPHRSGKYDPSKAQEYIANLFPELAEIIERGSKELAKAIGDSGCLSDYARIRLK